MRFPIPISYASEIGTHDSSETNAAMRDAVNIHPGKSKLLQQPLDGNLPITGAYRLEAS